MAGEKRALPSVSTQYRATAARCTSTSLFLSESLYSLAGAILKFSAWKGSRRKHYKKKNIVYYGSLRFIRDFINYGKSAQEAPAHLERRPTLAGARGCCAQTGRETRAQASKAWRLQTSTCQQQCDEWLFFLKKNANISAVITYNYIYFITT